MGRDVAKDSSGATVANASWKDGHAMGGKNVLMGAMRPQSYVEPTARRWQEGLNAPMVNASGKNTNVMD